MKGNYKVRVSLACDTCGGNDFEFNEDRSYVKCKLCNREYLGGYDELVSFNQEQIGAAIETTKREITADIKESIRKSFKGNNFIKFK